MANELECSAWHPFFAPDVRYDTMTRWMSMHIDRPLSRPKKKRAKKDGGTEQKKEREG